MHDEDEPVVKDDVEAACWSEAYAAILADPQNNYDDYDDLVADAKEQADIAVTLLRTRRTRGAQQVSSSGERDTAIASTLQALTRVEQACQASHTLDVRDAINQIRSTLLTLKFDSADSLSEVPHRLEGLTDAWTLERWDRWAMSLLGLSGEIKSHGRVKLREMIAERCTLTKAEPGWQVGERVRVSKDDWSSDGDVVQVDAFGLPCRIAYDGGAEFWVLRTSGELAPEGWTIERCAPGASEPTTCLPSQALEWRSDKMNEAIIEVERITGGVNVGVEGVISWLCAQPAETKGDA